MFPPTPNVQLACGIVMLLLIAAQLILYFRKAAEAESLKKSLCGWRTRCCKQQDELDDVQKLIAEARESVSQRKGDTDEIVYLQSMLAAVNTDRNRALEMATALRKWRDQFWENSVRPLFTSLFLLDEETDGGMLEGLRAAFDRDTDKFLTVVKDVTDWPENIPPLRRPAPAKASFGDAKDRSLYQCQKSSSPEDSDSSEAI